MKRDIPVRIIVSGPLAGVFMKVQRGRSGLLEPIAQTPDSLTFEFEIRVDLTGDFPNFLGEFAQGPKDARFVYVNSGSCAGQYGTQWSRRAKLSLMSVTRQQVERILDKPGSFLETTMPGVGRDGGPTCASVKGLVWKVT